MKKIPVFVLLFFVLSQSIGCSAATTYKKSALLLGTIVEVQIVPEKRATKAYLDDAIESAFSEIRKVEKTFSLYDADSELFCLNASVKGRPYKVSEEFLFLLKKADFFFRLTEGAFDVSMAPLGKMWREANESKAMPDEAKLRNTLESVGMDKIIIGEENRTVELKEGMSLDFGAIATGYAVDKAVCSLAEKGIKNAVVNAGGDIYCLGNGLNGFGWQIGIRHPRRKGDCIATLLIKDRAITTSGDYEKFYVIGGEKFSHIVNPKTGMPVEEVPMSVTVLAEDCLTADALATGVFVLGPEKGMELLNKLENTEGVIISKAADGFKIETSKGLKEIEISDER